MAISALTTVDTSLRQVKNTQYKLIQPPLPSLLGPLSDSTEPHRGTGV